MRKAILSAAILALVCAGADAQQRPELPAKAPVPEASPAAPAPQEVEEKGAAGDKQVEEPAEKAPPAAPEPAEKAPPAALEPAEKAKPAAPEAEKSKTGDNAAQAPAAPPKPDEACEKALTDLGVRYERLPPIRGKETCGVPVPYNVSEIAPGIALEPKTEITCPAALALARWVKGVVIPASEALGEGVTPTTLAHASTYVCRGRNNQADAEPSEHSFGNAIDIASFAFRNHETIAVEPRAGEGTMAEAFQRTVQAGACLHFTTVLGPGSDEYHNDHLHLDVAVRSGGFRLCQ